MKTTQTLLLSLLPILCILLLPDAISFETTSRDEPLICRITTVDTYIDGYAGDSDEASNEVAKYDVCIPILNKRESPLLLPITLDPILRANYEEKVKTGTLLVSIPGAMIHRRTELILPENVQMYVFEKVPDHLRHLSTLSRRASVTGTLSVLVVRVTTKDGKSPTASLQKLRTHLFGDGISMKSQYAACSFNKLNFVEADSIDVKLDQSSSYYKTPGQLVDAASLKVRQLKGASPETLADKVIFCQPGVVKGWAAVAPVNHWRLNFNNEWCTSLSASMHEMGHSIGLLHSGKGTKEYGDKSGYMGYGSKSQKTPLKCFNAHNNWQLEWYKDRSVALSSESPSKVNLATFVDYEDTSSEHVVVVNIDNTYFLQYNRAKDFNKETEDAINKAAIVTPVYGGTRLIGAIDNKDTTFTVTNYRNGKDLIVKVCEKNSNGGISTMIVSIGLGKSYCDVSIPDPESDDPENCKQDEESCTSDSQCCGDNVCLGKTGSTRKCSACLILFRTCSRNGECCEGMNCNGGICRAA